MGTAEFLRQYDVIEEEKAVAEADNWFTQSIFSEISEEIYQRGSFTVAIIHACAGKKLYEGVGFSKANKETPIAQWDSERGKTIAKGRAIHDLFGEFRRDQKNGTIRKKEN